MSVLLIESALKVSVILLSALVAGSLLGGRSAALRHWMLGVAVVCAWAAAPLSGVLPSWPTVQVWRRSATVVVRTAPATGSRAPRNSGFNGRYDPSRTTASIPSRLNI